MTHTPTPTAEDAWGQLFERLRQAKPTVVATVARDTGIDPQHLDPGFDHILDLVADPVPTPEQIGIWRAEGARLARQGFATERVLDGLLSLNWAIWEALMDQPDIDHTVVLDFADRLLRGLDDGVAAISEGYLQVEIALAAEHSHERRAVLEELLSAPRTTPEDRARIRRRGERHGLAAQAAYRLILVRAPGKEDDEIERAIDALEQRLRSPRSHHREKPGIHPPVVLDWRGRVLVFATARWAGERRLREALPAVLGTDVIVLDSGPVEGTEALASALGEVEYAARVAETLGRRGWIGDPGQLALESTFLLDQHLVQRAIARELGPLLSDPRMGEELVRTLEVYLGAGQNTREAARRLHLATRTVAYRLERIESLLGHEIDGEAAVRLSAALLALRVSRQAGVAAT